MKKLFLALAFLVTVLFVGPTSASADDGSGTTLRHAYRPVTVDTTRAMRARVDNFTPVAQKRLVCVEAFNNATNVKTHLGCLWVDLSPMGGNMWAAEFDAPTYKLVAGNYTVVYTYQDDAGSWHRIKSTDLKVMDGMYRAM